MVLNISPTNVSRDNKRVQAGVWGRWVEDGITLHDLLLINVDPNISTDRGKLATCLGDIEKKYDDSFRIWT